MRKNRKGLSMSRRRPRQVLECASLLALWQWRRADQKRQRTGAVQDATARSSGSGPNSYEESKGALHERKRRAGVSPALVGEADARLALPRARKRSPGRRDACPTLSASAVHVLNACAGERAWREAPDGFAGFERNSLESNLLLNSAPFIRFQGGCFACPRKPKVHWRRGRACWRG